MDVAAVWKIVKTWLGPEAVSKLKFSSRSEVQTFIDPEYLPLHMGGTVGRSPPERTHHREPTVENPL